MSSMRFLSVLCSTGGLSIALVVAGSLFLTGNNIGNQQLAPFNQLGTHIQFTDPAYTAPTLPGVADELTGGIDGTAQLFIENSGFISLSQQEISEITPPIALTF